MVLNRGILQGNAQKIEENPQQPAKQDLEICLKEAQTVDLDPGMEDESLVLNHVSSLGQVMSVPWTEGTTPEIFDLFIKKGFLLAGIAVAGYLIGIIAGIVLLS